MKQAHICYNGKMLPAETALFNVENRAFRYGDSIFESICVADGKIPLLDQHFERMQNGAAALKFNWPKKFTKALIMKNVTELLKLNGLSSARLRLSVFRENGGFYLPENNNINYVIESFKLSREPFSFNEDGFVIDIYSETEKHFSAHSPYKTANGLLYVLAAIYKNEHKLDDCLILNSRSRVIESVDSNFFLVKGGEIFTPPLAEGCVAGVMRAYMLSHILPAQKIPFHELPITLQELFEADEVFLTNAIYGVRWVKQYKVKNYTNEISRQLNEAVRRSLLG